MLKFVEEHGRDWKKVGAMLARYPESCRDRHRRICGTYNSGAFTAEEDMKCDTHTPKPQ